MMHRLLITYPLWADLIGSRTHARAALYSNLKSCCFFFFFMHIKSAPTERASELGRSTHQPNPFRLREGQTGLRGQNKPAALGRGACCVLSSPSTTNMKIIKRRGPTITPQVYSPPASLPPPSKGWRPGRHTQKASIQQFFVVFF